MGAITDRRIRRAENVYATVLASSRDVTAEPRIVRAFRVVYRYRTGTKEGLRSQTTGWRKSWRMSLQGGTPLRPYVSATVGSRYILIGVERAWMVEPNQCGLLSSIWVDLLCAQAMRDALVINHAKWLMLEGTRDAGG